MVLVVVLWLIMLAFFASGEIALMALDPLGLETEARQGRRSALILQRLRSSPQTFLTAMLIGNNIASASLTAYFTAECLRRLGGEDMLGPGKAMLVATVTMVVLQTIFGELVPKTIAAVDSSKLALRLAVPLNAVQVVLTPFTWLLEKMIMPIVRLLAGGRTVMDATLSRAELHTALAIAHASGQLHITDAAVASEALHLSQRKLSDVMTPRVDVVAMAEDGAVGEALSEMNRSGFSRLPVFSGDLDHIIGVLFLKDLVRISLNAAEGGRDPLDAWTELPARPYMRLAIHFPETKSVVEALSEMRIGRYQLAVVVDEHGGTAGIATLEDIIEELVGEIHDETDEGRADIIRSGDDYMIVSGRTRIEQIAWLRDADIEDAESNTVGGLLMERLGRAVRVGDSIEVGGYRITALKVLRTRIKLLKIEPLPNQDELSDAASE